MNHRWLEPLQREKASCDHSWVDPFTDTQSVVVYSSGPKLLQVLQLILVESFHPLSPSGIYCIQIECKLNKLQLMFKFGKMSPDSVTCVTTDPYVCSRSTVLVPPTTDHHHQALIKPELSRACINTQNSV